MNESEQKAAHKAGLSTIDRWLLWSLLALSVLIIPVGISAGVLVAGNFRSSHPSSWMPPVPNIHHQHTIESLYQPQIDRVVDLAKDPALLANHSAGDPSDVTLFAPPEILEASVNRLAHRQVIAKGHQYRSRSTFHPQSPSVNTAVVNMYTDTLSNGRTQIVLAYEYRLTDNQGNDVSAVILFDHTALVGAPIPTSPSRP